MTPLRGLRVLEVGDRIGAGLTGGLLALLGADVGVVVPGPIPGTWKWRNTAAALHRKRAVDAAALASELAVADVVVASSDVAPLPQWPRGTGQVVCDITAHGAGSPRAGIADSDAMVRTLAGLVDTTGAPDAAPVIGDFPLLEGMAALHAAAGILAALLARRRAGKGQDVAVALHDCAIACLPAFLALHAAGRPAARIGNRHPLVAPSNLYPARDGAVVICTATDQQFRRLAAAMQAPRLATDPRYATQAARLAHRDALDAEIATWTMARPVADVVAAIGSVGLPAAPVLDRAALLADHNLAVRGSLQVASDPVTAMAVPVLGRPIHVHANSRVQGAPVERRPVSGADDAPPLAGLTVVEIGGYATVPLAGSHLAALGARVIKLEPPRGDAARALEPGQDGQGTFFTLHNTGKEFRTLDLARPDGLKALRGLLAHADVLIENLRPGTLAALGLDRHGLARINPRLTYCAVTGFGTLTAYPHRPAFDTVAQAMSGIMDRTRVAGAPFRVGASVCAIAAGIAGLVAVLAGLLLPGGGEADVAMQDIGAWLTHWEWNGVRGPAARVLSCVDGFAVVEGVADPFPAGLTRAALVAHVTAAGGRAAPVRGVAEALASAETAASGMVGTTVDARGQSWPVMASPIRLSRTQPPRAGSPHAGSPHAGLPGGSAVTEAA